MIFRQIILIFLIFNSWGIASANEFMISNLKSNESLEIRFHSRGCFHKKQVNIKIFKKDIYLAQVSETHLYTSPTIKLSTEDVQHVDQLIKYYRSIKEPGGCTTVDNISLLWQGPNIKPSIEPFSDATCNAPELGYQVIQKFINRLEHRDAERAF